MREPTKERKYGLKKNIHDIFCRAEEVWTPGKREKRDFGLMESKKVWLVVTCEWAAFAILVMF